MVKRELRVDYFNIPLITLPIWQILELKASSDFVCSAVFGDELTA